MLIRRIFYESFENLPCEATSRVSKNFSRRQIKNPFLTKVAECSGDEKRYLLFYKVDLRKKKRKKKRQIQKFQMLKKLK